MRHMSFAVFRFVQGRGNEGKKYIDSYYTILKKQKGLVKAYISQGAGDPDSFFIYSEWKDEKSHNEMIKNAKSLLTSGTDYMSILPLLFTTPVFESYKIIHE